MKSLTKMLACVALFLCIDSSCSFQPVALLANIPEAHPVAFAVSATCFKTTAADFLAQKLKKSKDEDMDWRRLAGFTIYGALYLGLFQFWLYTRFYTKMFPSAKQFAAKSLTDKLADPFGAISVARQVSMEALVHWPWAFVPSYYVIQEFVKPRGFSLSGLVKAVRQNWWGDMKVCWSIWLPAMTFNFGTLPVEWQVPFTAFVSFAYTMLLSMRRGNNKDETQTQTPTQQKVQPRKEAPVVVKRVKIPAQSYPVNRTIAAAVIG